MAQPWRVLDLTIDTEERRSPIDCRTRHRIHVGFDPITALNEHHSLPFEVFSAVYVALSSHIDFSRA